METNDYIQRTSEYLSKIFDVGADAIVLILPQALVLSIVFLVAALVLLRFLSKRGIFTRDNRMWNLLSKIHYPLWIAILVAAGFTIGSINAVIGEAEEVLEDTFKPYVEANLPALRELLVEQLPEYAPDELITVEDASRRLLQYLYYKPRNDGVIESIKARGVNWATLNFGKWVISYSIAAMITMANEAGAHLHLSDETNEFTKNTIKRMDLSQVNKNIAQIVYEAVDGQVRAVLRNLQLQYAIFFTVLIGLLCVEPGLYFLWWKKREDAELSNKAL